MFGDGISITDLVMLLGEIRKKDLVLQVKIVDNEWVDLSRAALQAMIHAIATGTIQGAADIRLRLFARDKPTVQSVLQSK